MHTRIRRRLYIYISYGSVSLETPNTDGKSVNQVIQMNDEVTKARWTQP